MTIYHDMAARPTVAGLANDENHIHEATAPITTSGIFMHTKAMCSRLAERLLRNNWMPPTSSTIAAARLASATPPFRSNVARLIWNGIITVVVVVVGPVDDPLAVTNVVEVEDPLAVTTVVVLLLAMDLGATFDITKNAPEDSTLPAFDNPLSDATMMLMTPIAVSTLGRARGYGV